MNDAGKAKGAGAEEPAAREPGNQKGKTTAAAFLASKNSKVFHKAGCESAAKISAKNVIEYGTREEAIRDGKTPCQECKP